MLNDALYTSLSSDWETPDWLFNKLDQEFHFTLDVCASRSNAKTKRYFSTLQDGLIQPWSDVCWMNPPYGRTIRLWVKKAHEESQLGATVVCLVPARTDTAWWHQYVMKHEIRFLTKRLSFKGSNNKAPFPCAVVVMRREEGLSIGTIEAQ